MLEDENQQKKLELPFEKSRRGKRLEEEQETKAIGRRLASYVGSRLIDRPSIGKRRGRRGDIDAPTGGVPGTRTPTGSDLDPDRDGWTDEGTTRPRWIGLPSADKKPRQVVAPRRERKKERTQRLSSAQEKIEPIATTSSAGQYESDLNEAREEYRRLRDAVAELERTGDWTGGDNNVVISGTDSYIDIARFGINDINIKPKNQTRQELEKQIRDRLSAQGVNDEQQIKQEVEKEIKKRIELARKKLDRAEQMVAIKSYALEAKRTREAQNVLDVEEIPEEKIAILVEESGKIIASGPSGRYPLFRSEHTDGDYFVHHGASELDGGVLDPEKSVGTRGAQRGAASAVGDTRMVNDISSAGFTRDLVENRALERGFRSVLSKILSSPENSKIESNEEINAISRIIDSPYIAIMPGGKSRGWRIGNELSFESLQKAYKGKNLKIDSLVAVIERNIKDSKDRADSATRTAAILEKNNGQYISVFAGAYQAVSGSGWKGYFGRRKTEGFLSTQEKLDDVMKMAFVESDNRATTWLGYGEWGSEISDRVGPYDEWQVLSKNRPIFGISAKTRGSGTPSDHKSAQIHEKIMPALIAHAIKMHKERGSVNIEDLIDGVGKRRLSSGRGTENEKPKYPRRPSFGPIIDGAQEEFASVRTWREFKEKLKTKPLIFLDYESTGVVNDEWDGWLSNGNPTQIGAVKVIDGKIVGRFNVYMNPEQPLGDWSLKNLKDADGNPITDEWLATQMSIADAHRQFAEFAGEDAILVVQNARFDKEVLERSLIESKIEWSPSGYLDTMVISEMTLPKWNATTDDGPYRINSEGEKKPSSSLAAITKYLGVDLVKHHSAEADAETASRVLSAITEKAIQKDWPNDIFDQEIRQQRMESEESRFVQKVQEFEDSKSLWLDKQKQEKSATLSSGEEDYRGIHTAPDRDSGAPLHDLLSVYPEDVYSADAIRLYGGGDENDENAFSLIRRYRNRPDAQITIYRAVPLSIEQQINELLKQQQQILRRGKVPRKANTKLTSSEYFERLAAEIKSLREKLKDDKKPSINPGDWVTPFEDYARFHGRSALNGKFKIVRKTVRAKDLYTNGDSWMEWGYDPELPKKLSSGQDRPIIVLEKPIQENPETMRAHKEKKYKYGDKSLLGGEIRRIKNDWLRGLSSEQIANLVVPGSIDEYFEQYMDDYAPAWRDLEKNDAFVKSMKAMFDKYFVDNPHAVPDFSPESVAAIRLMVKDAVDSSPKLRWGFETHGAPIFYMQTKEGAALFAEIPVMKAKLQMLDEQRRKINPNFKGSFFRALSNPFLNSVSFNPRHAIDRESYADGGKIKVFSEESDTVSPNDITIDKSLTGVLTHEWGHWLHFRAARDYELAGKQKNRTYYGSGDPSDDAYIMALAIAEEYKDRTPTLESMREWEDGIDIQTVSDRPRTITSYGNVNKPEAMAEAVVSIFHPNETMKDYALNAKLRRDAYSLLQITEGSEPWKKDGEQKRLSSGVDSKTKPKVQYKKTQIAKKARDFTVSYVEDDKRRELARQTLKKGFDGGFTVELDTMDDIKRGIAVARNRRGMTFSAKMDFDEQGNPSEELVDDFVAWLDFNGPEQFDNPSDGASRVAVGGWVFKGELFLDVTDIYPTDKYLDKAAELGLKQRQISVTHLEKLWELIDSGAESLDPAFIGSGGDGGEIISRDTVRKFATAVNAFRVGGGGKPPFPTRIMREQKRARRRLMSGEIVDQKSVDKAKSIIYETLDGMPQEKMRDLAEKRKDRAFPDPSDPNNRETLTEEEIKTVTGIVNAGKELRKAILAEIATDYKRSIDAAGKERNGRYEGLPKEEVDKADEIKIQRAILSLGDIDVTAVEYARALVEQSYDGRTLGDVARDAARDSVFGFRFEDEDTNNGLIQPIVVGRERFIESIKLILEQSGNGERVTPASELVDRSRKQLTRSSDIIENMNSVKSAFSTPERLTGKENTEVRNWSPRSGVTYVDTPMDEGETALVEENPDAAHDVIQIMSDASETLNVIIAEIGRGIGAIGNARQKNNDSTEVRPENITDEEILELHTKGMRFVPSNNLHAFKFPNGDMQFNPYTGESGVFIYEEGKTNRVYRISANGDVTPLFEGEVYEQDIPTINEVKKYSEEFLHAGIAARKKLLIDLVRRGLEDEATKRVIKQSDSHVTMGDVVGSDFYLPQGTRLKEVTRLVDRLKEKHNKNLDDISSGDFGGALPRLKEFFEGRLVNETGKRFSGKNIKYSRKDAEQFIRLEEITRRQKATLRVLRAAGIEFSEPSDINQILIKQPSGEQIANTPARDVARRANAVFNGVIKPNPGEDYDFTPEQQEFLRTEIGQVISLIPKAFTDGTQSGVLDSSYTIDPLKLQLINVFDAPGRRAHATDWYWSPNAGETMKRATIVKFELPRGTPTDTRPRTPNARQFGPTTRDINSWQSIYLHESIHGVENANPWLKFAQWLHWESRRGVGEQPQKLEEISGNPGYKDNEVAVRDLWRNAYAGKVYQSEKPWESNWEILTTGAQAVFFGDERADEDHLGFTLGVLLAAIPRRRYRQDTDKSPRQSENEARRLSSGGPDWRDQRRREMGRLLAQKDTLGMSRTMVSIANDYINYRYEMNDEMVEALIRRLKNLPDYPPEEWRAEGKFSSGATPQKQTFFHGTTAKLNVGDEILPPSETGVEPRSNPEIPPSEFNNREYVYLSSYVDDADSFAEESVSIGRGERKYVYEVEPIGNAEEDPESIGGFGGLTDSYRAPRARVVRIVGIDEIERGRRLSEALGPDRGFGLDSKEYKKLIDKWLKQEEKLKTPKFSGPPTKKNVSAFLKKYYIDASNIVQSEPALVEFTLSATNDEERKQLQDNLLTIREWASQRLLDVDAKEESPTTTRVTIYDRLSSGRTTEEKLKEGPKELTFGKDANGIPVIASTPVLVARFGKSSGQIKKYFKKKYKINVDISKKVTNPKKYPDYHDSGYAALQALDDLLINMPGIQELLRDNDFTVELSHGGIEGGSPLYIPTGILGTFGPRGRVFKTQRFNDGDKQKTKLVINLHEVTKSAKKFIDTNFTVHFRGLMEGQYGQGEAGVEPGGNTTGNMLAMLGLPSFDNSFLTPTNTDEILPPWRTSPKEWDTKKLGTLQREAEARFSYATMVHEFGHLIDFGMRDRENQALRMPSMLRVIMFSKFSGQSEARPGETEEQRADRVAETLFGADPQSIYESALRREEIDRLPGITVYGATKHTENLAESFASWFLFSTAPKIRTRSGVRRYQTIGRNRIEVVERTNQAPRPMQIAETILRPLFEKLGPRLSSGGAVAGSVQDGASSAIDPAIKENISAEELRYWSEVGRLDPLVLLYSVLPIIAAQLRQFNPNRKKAKKK